MVRAEEVEADCLPCQVNTEPRSYDHPRNTKGKKHQHGFLGLQQQQQQDSIQRVSPSREL